MEDNPRVSRTVAACFLSTVLLISITLLDLTGAASAGPGEVGSISGTVRDENGVPLAGAAVIILGKQIGSATDSSGTFQIRSAPVGTLTLRAQLQGRGRDERMGVEVVSGITTHVDFVLRSPGDEVAVNPGNVEPCDDPNEQDPDEMSLVQIGVRSEKKSGKVIYTYKVVNRSRDSLTAIRIGYDARRGRCELTGASSHVVPDTAFGPPGWVCTPVQGDDPRTFALSWKLEPDTGAHDIAARSTSSEFTVVLHRRDGQYSEGHWVASTGQRFHDYIGRLKTRREVDAISMDVGTIAGKVTNNQGLAIEGATVMVWHGGLTAATASDGTYALADVPVGEYTLMAIMAGYERCARNGVRVDASMAASADIHLSTREVSVPCADYKTRSARHSVDAPRRAIDTRDAMYLDRGKPIPDRSPGQAPRPYIYSLTDRDIEVVYRGLGADTASRAYVATVHREFRNPLEERLLGVAEGIYPPAKAVVSVADNHAERSKLLREERLWWFGDFDGVRLPFAVTMDAVHYYLKLTQTFGRGDRTPPHQIPMIASKFSYTATVSPGPRNYTRGGRTFRDVYVVEMKLSWWDYCGSLCACGFDLDRTVLFLPDGTLVCVFGDRKPLVGVS